MLTYFHNYENLYNTGWQSILNIRDYALNVLLPKRIVPLGPRDGEMKFNALILPVGLMQFLKCYVFMGS